MALQPSQEPSQVEAEGRLTGKQPELGIRIHSFSVAVVLLCCFRDGMLDAPNYDAIERMVRDAGVPVIAAGGVADVAQIGPLAATGVEAVIIGRALYDGRVDLPAAIQEAERAR